MGEGDINGVLRNTYTKDGFDETKSCLRVDWEMREKQKGVAEVETIINRKSNKWDKKIMRKQHEKKTWEKRYVTIELIFVFKKSNKLEKPG